MLTIWSRRRRRKTCLSGSNFSAYLLTFFALITLYIRFIHSSTRTHACPSSQFILFSIYITIGVCHTQHHETHNCIWNVQLFGTNADTSNQIQYWLLMSSDYSLILSSNQPCTPYTIYIYIYMSLLYSVHVHTHTTTTFIQLNENNKKKIKTNREK